MANAANSGSLLLWQIVVATSGKLVALFLISGWVVFVAVGICFSSAVATNNSNNSNSNNSNSNSNEPWLLNATEVVSSRSRSDRDRYALERHGHGSDLSL